LGCTTVGDLSTKYHRENILRTPPNHHSAYAPTVKAADSKVEGALPVILVLSALCGISNFNQGTKIQSPKRIALSANEGRGNHKVRTKFIKVLQINNNGAD
jgi:hypothetical protein